MKVLIVDDNNRYAENLEKYFALKNIVTKRAYNAEEGYQFFRKENFDAVVSDITMETQVSGLLFVRRIYKEGYKGKIIIATTGFDFPGVMTLSRYILPLYAGAGWMVPKVPLKKGEVIFVNTTAGKGQPF